MNIVPPIILISFAWFISEILLGIFKRSRDKSASRLDKSSFRVLWSTIMISTAVGVFVGIRGIGFISSLGYWLFISGLALIIIGLVIRWAAIFTLRRYFTVNVAVVEGQKVIDTGLYKYIRHPSYAGSVLSFLGLGLSFSNWLTPIIITVPILLAYLYRIKVEEIALVQTLGDDYVEYMKRTKRLIPGIY